MEAKWLPLAQVPGCTFAPEPLQLPLPHLDSSNDEPVVVATVKVRTASPAAVLEQRYNGRKGAEQVRRRRANFGHDPRLTACREVARTHQGLHGGHPGDHHAAPPVSCVSVSSRMSATECAYLPVHSTCAEGAHVSPSTLGPSSGTGWTSPSSLARSAACFHAKGALRGRGPLPETVAP